MMGFTHIVIGVASSMAVLQPKTTDDLLMTLVGSAVGSIACDFDVKPNKFARDAVYAREAAGMIAAVSLMLAWKMKTGFFDRVISGNMILQIAGLAIVIGCAVGAALSEHRTYAHSFTALAVYSVGIALIDLHLLLPFAIAFVSHVLLDIFNKQPLQLFFPLKPAFCLKWCGADGLANKILLFVGAAAIIVLGISAI